MVCLSIDVLVLARLMVVQVSCRVFKTCLDSSVAVVLVLSVVVV